MKILFLRPGATDNSGNPVGFKAEPGSEEAKRLIMEGYVPDAGDTPQEGMSLHPLTAEELQLLDLDALRNLAKQRGVRGGGKMHEVQLVAAILGAQEVSDGANDDGIPADPSAATD